MQGILISSIRIRKMDFSLMTNKTLHGWKQSWLPWHHALYNWVVFCGIEGFQDMLKLGNMRRHLSFLKKCDKKAQLLTASMLNACTSLGACEEGR
jgi:hypothetical protein